MAPSKTSKSELFAGLRYTLIVSTFLCQLESYLSLNLVGNSQLALDDTAKFVFASTLLNGNAVNCWYMIAHLNQAPGQRTTFTETLRQEFIPMNSVRWVRDRRRRSSQKVSVSS